MMNFTESLEIILKHIKEIEPGKRLPKESFSEEGVVYASKLQVIIDKTWKPHLKIIKALISLDIDEVST